MTTLPISARVQPFSADHFSGRPVALAGAQALAEEQHMKATGSRTRAAGQAPDGGKVLAGLLGLWTQIQRHGLNGSQTSSSDELTGLPTRRTLNDHLQALLQGRGQSEPALRGRAPNSGRPVWSVLLIDIDHFQRVNAQHGPQTGDEVLRVLTATLHGELRQSDILGRWSGEEFLAVLTDTPFEGALVVAERLRRAVSLRTFPAVGSVTVSIGVASVLHGDTPERVMSRASAGRVAAKREGRNRVAFTE